MSQTAVVRPQSRAVVRPKSRWQYALSNAGETFRALRRNRAGFIGFLLFTAIMLLSFVGPFFVKLDTATNIQLIYAPPSWRHPLGTDFQGRSVWPQVVHGGRSAIMVSLVGATVSTVVACSLGAFSALVGGRVDAFLSALADIYLTIPPLILLLVIAASYRPRLYVLAVILGLLSWPALFRAVRAQALSIRERDYIEAARSLGLGRGHIIFSEILPNMAGFVMISFILSMAGVMLALTNLVVFGLIPISGNNWAITLFQAQQKGAMYSPTSLLYIMGPIIAIVLFQFSLVTMTRSLEEIFNPRLRVNL